MDSFDTENKNQKLIEGPIPTKALMVAQRQGISADEIWGSYFPPNDDRNPNMGSHYLGLAKITSNEAIERVSKELLRLTQENIQKPWIGILDSIQNKSETEAQMFLEVGLTVIKEHELTHKKQHDEYEYQTAVLDAYVAMNETENEAKKTEIRVGYQNLVLLAEIQALSAQCSVEQVSPDSLKEFNMYWFSKTFKLFNSNVIKNNTPKIKSFDPTSGRIDVDYINKNVSWIEDVYTSLRNKSDFDPNISNIYGLLSRALYLCEDPAKTLEDVRLGNLSFEDFKSNVLIGLESMLKMTPEQIIEKGKVIKNQTSEPLKKAVKDLRRLIL